MKIFRLFLAALPLIAFAAAPASARRLVVHPGGSIRAAISRAVPGD